MDKQDLRYLLKCKTLPAYDQSKLAPVWNEIMKEYEKLTNNFGYSNMLRKISWDAQKVNRLNGLIACFYLLKYKQPGADEAVKYWNVSNNITSLTTVILREKTKLNIEAIRNKKQESKSEFDFDKMLIGVQNARERDFIDIDKLTVKQWVYECKAIEERVKQLEGLKNGRPGQDNSR